MVIIVFVVAVVVGGGGEPVDIHVDGTTGVEGGHDDVRSHLEARSMAALPGRLLGVLKKHDILCVP
jgi:hypothetical protein